MKKLENQGFQDFGKELAKPRIRPRGKQKTLPQTLPLDVDVTGLPDLPCQTYFITHVPYFQERAVLWFLENNEAERAVQLLRYWQNNSDEAKIYLFSEITPKAIYELITGQPIFILFSLDSIPPLLPSLKTFEDSVLKIKTPLTHSPAGLSHQLISLGYEFNRQTDQKGVFSRRGCIVDVFPVNREKPVRLEFKGSVIESIKEFDAVTKRTGQKINQIDVVPNQWPEEKSAEIFNYLTLVKNISVIYNDPDELKETYPLWPKIERKIKTYQKIIIQSFSGEGYQFDWQSAKYYHHHFPSFAADLKKYQALAWRIFIATQKEKEIKKILAAKEVASHRINFLPSDPYLSGFQSKKEKTIVLTDKEIFGAEFVRSEAKSITAKLDRLFISELKPGDYVVHLDHGVGKFFGMASHEVEGVTKEYFILQYSGADKLYVPIENANKISRYIGMAHPKVHRLSGGNWHQITKKVKEETKVLARQLLKLYAQRAMVKAPAFSEDTTEEVALEKSFKYQETDDQRKAIQEVKEDLKKEQPMDRLICGDVGFGKTEVAIRAAFKAAMNNKQVALLSPTTILTQQHYDTFCERLKNFPIKIAVLSRFESKKDQKKTIDELKNGLVDIIIGTHRLLSPDVKFKNLGLVIIDEEQRFGVRDKEKLKALRSEAHILTLTATPIPRTMNIALAGIRDVSTIQTPPEGRLPIETIIEPYSEATVKKAISHELTRKGQVYFLHNRVETISSVTSELKKLLPKMKIGIAHGQLPEKELAQTMQKFDRQKINVLACSTIIENGLDLPNVNTLIVDNSTRFGLAQLYQLRGRIGRGWQKAYAYFLYRSKELTAQAKKRLQALLEARELGSGFQLALRDLEIRGAGSILGRDQHGHIASIGYSLYTRLLAQTIEELKEGRSLEPIRDISIDLPLAAYIPKEFIPRQDQRIILYQKMASISNLEELRKLKADIKKNLPAPLENLFQILELKILCQKTDISSLDTVSLPTPSGERVKKIIIKFIKLIHPDQIGQLLKRNQAWQFTQDSIKIDLAELGEKWLDKLRKVIKIFEK